MKKGVELPFSIAAVGIDGSCMFFKYFQTQAGLKAKLITGHIEDQGFGLPIIEDRKSNATNLLRFSPCLWALRDDHVLHYLCCSL